MMAQDELHIGRLIKEVFDASGMSISTFADKLNKERTDVYSIFKRRTMDFELLQRVSEVLNHNFLDDVLSNWEVFSSYHSPQIHIVIDLNRMDNDQWQRILALIGEIKKVASGM